MHIKGAISDPLTDNAKSMLANRYIHSRLIVSKHNAAGVLKKAYTQSTVKIVRNFPGAIPAAYKSVGDMLKKRGGLVSR